MALAFQSGESIKQALFEELQNILSPIKEIRTQAESRMKHLEFTEGYGVYLAEFIMNQSFDLALRQLSCVMLTKYVEEHWNVGCEEDGAASSAAAGTTPNAVKEQARQMIRKILPNGLYDSNSKIRVSVAYTISTIASMDWPDTWTDLFDIIVKCLGGNEDSIHGAMQVLVEFTYDMDSQISVVGPVILSEIYRIFEAEQVYCVKTRSCAVTIFKSLLKAINEHIETKEEKAKMLNPVLPVFIDKLIGALNSPSGPHSSFELKTEIIRVLTYMVNEMSKFIFQYNAQILPPVWQLLTQTADIYVKVVVNDINATSTGNTATPFDVSDDDELSNFTTLVLQLIEFIHSIVEKNRFRSTVTPVLTDLVYIAIVYMQITQEQIESWNEDVETYVDDFSAESGECTIRMSSKDVLTNVAEEFGPKILLPALSEALARHVSVAEAEKVARNPNWWKIIEAASTAVGELNSIVMSSSTNNVFSDYLRYVKTMLGSGGIGSGYVDDVSPYLHGKCLWLLCRYSDAAANIYDRQTLQEILDCVASNLSASKPMAVQVSSMRSLCELCQGLMNGSEEQRAMVIEKMLVFVNFITDIVTRAKKNVLSDILMAIVAVTSFDKTFTANHQGRIIPFTIAIFLKYHEDPFILEQVLVILQVLCENQYCIGPLQEKLIPTLVSILNLENRLDMERKHLMQDTSLNILQTIVQHAAKPLTALLVDTAFPATVKCILSTDDHAIMQSGGECLRAFINASPEQICSYNNGEGLNFIMQVTTMLLNPMSNEFTASFVGRLVITIVSKCGNYLGENIHLLLKAVISKLQLVESLSVIMSLVMTFAHLVVTQMEAVLNFLSTVPGPTGEPAIQFVFTQWLTRQHLFYGTYERKVSTMALCKLFEYGITTCDTRLTSVTIRDVAETNLPAGRTRTRSSTAHTQQQWVALPVLVKIFKLLINELNHLKESSLVNEESDYNTDDEDGDVDEAGNPIGENGSSPQSGQSLSLLRTSQLWCDDDEEDDDQMLQELLQDPIFQTSMEDNLTKFMRNFALADQFADYAHHLTENEKNILRGIQVNV